MHILLLSIFDDILMRNKVWCHIFFKCIKVYFKAVFWCLKVRSVYVRYLLLRISKHSALFYIRDLLTHLLNQHF